MKFNGKAGILLLLLALPVFIWLFLKFFGQNRFEVPVYYEEGTSQQGCPDDQQPHVIPPFSLQSLSKDVPATEKMLNGRVSAVFFLNPPCDAACIQVMEELARVQDVFEKQGPVQLITISNFKADARELATRFNSREDRWKFLMGESQEVQDLKRCGFVLTQPPETNPSVVLIDEKRRIRGYYAGTDPEDMDRLILEIRILLYTIHQEDNA